VVGDWREPDVLRLAPIPLYNSYSDVFAAVDALSRALRR
jgi:kynureninase